jgi:2-oxoisovalerate dehydrogenase E1 component
VLGDRLRADHDDAEDRIAAIEADAAAEVDDAVAFADAAARARRAAHPVGLHRRLLGHPDPGRCPMTATTYREALREGLREALAADDRVLLMGEDVGAYGGSFAVSLGLVEQFGPTG